MTDIREVNPGMDAATVEWIDRFAPYGVIATDRELRVQRWNQWMQTNSGMRADSVLGRRLTEIFPDLIERRLIGQLERALNGEVSVLSTALHGHLLPLPPPSRDWGFRWMRQTARIAPLLIGRTVQGTIIVIEDVTHREWQADILRRQHARDQILSWASAHLLKTHDPRRITRELFCKVAEHLDFDTYLFYLFEPKTKGFQLFASGGVPPDREASLQHLPAGDATWISPILEGKTMVREDVQLRQDPSEDPAREWGLSAYVTLPLMAGESTVGILFFGTHSREKIAAGEVELLETISQYLAVALDREKTDRELRHAQTLLNAHTHELERNVAERTANLKQTIAELQTFSYTVAHDLRAPIRALKGYCDVLIEDYAKVLSGQGAFVLAGLRNAAVRMDALTRDLLEFSSVSRQDIALTAVSLDDLAVEILAAAGPASVQVTVQRPLPDVMAHRTLVEQCISNLLQNALKFVAAGAVPAIRLRSETLEAGGVRRVRLWVEDQGIGIAPEEQQKIFGIFERGSASKEYEGTGIGLAIVARAMQRMDGKCGVESTPGVGSRFWLEFQGA